MMVWGEEPSDVFIVKIGYKILMHGNREATGDRHYMAFYKKTLVDKFTKENQNYSLEKFLKLRS